MEFSLSNVDLKLVQPKLVLVVKGLKLDSRGCSSHAGLLDGVGIYSNLGVGHNYESCNATHG